MLFAFSSQQILTLFPFLFDTGKDLLYGDIDLSTLVGGAAGNLFSGMIAMSLNSTVKLDSNAWDWNILDTPSTNITAN